MRKAVNDSDCADCLCRVCARNEHNDSWNPQVDIDRDYCMGCNACHEEVIETEEDCPRGQFLPDESEAKGMLNDMENTPSLKQCPFCGFNYPVVMKRLGVEGWRDWYYVICDWENGGCGASGQWNHSKEEAIGAWNRRAK